MTDDARTGGPFEAHRSNGLVAQTWVAVCDVDQQYAVPVLDALRAASVPAYIAPSAGGAPPVGRLWVDSALRREAEQVVATRLPALRASLEDAQWAELVASLTSETGAAAPEPGDAPTYAGALSTPPVDPADPADDDHFVPPDPPLAPLENRGARFGWIALIGGCVMLLVPALVGHALGSGWLLIAVAAIVGGFGTLVLRMKDSPPTDSGPDDGAVV